jgi:DNA-directed RNA polymerase alpha subunit
MNGLIGEAGWGNPIETLDQLTSMTRGDLMKLPNIGKKSVDEIQVELMTRGLELAT